MANPFSYNQAMLGSESGSASEENPLEWYDQGGLTGNESALEPHKSGLNEEAIMYFVNMLGKGLAPNNPFAPMGEYLASNWQAQRKGAAMEMRRASLQNAIRSTLLGKEGLSEPGLEGLSSLTMKPNKNGTTEAMLNYTLPKYAAEYDARNDFLIQPERRKELMAEEAATDKLGMEYADLIRAALKDKAAQAAADEANKIRQQNYALNVQKAKDTNAYREALLGKDYELTGRRLKLTERGQDIAHQDRMASIAAMDARYNTMPAWKKEDFESITLKRNKEIEKLDREAVDAKPENKKVFEEQKLILKKLTDAENFLIRGWNPLTKAPIDGADDALAAVGSVNDLLIKAEKDYGYAFFQFPEEDKQTLLKIPILEGFKSVGEVQKAIEDTIQKDPKLNTPEKRQKAFYNAYRKFRNSSVEAPKIMDEDYVEKSLEDEENNLDTDPGFFN